MDWSNPQLGADASHMEIKQTQINIESKLVCAYIHSPPISHSDFLFLVRFLNKVLLFSLIFVFL